jgi:GxxExxY protein
MLETNQITGHIVDAAYHVHTRIGPGLLESVYEILLARVLESRGLHVERQKPVSFEFDGLRFEDAFRADLFIESSVIVELKAVEKLAPVHSKQVLTYLTLLDLPVGLLINFGAPRFTDGIQRVFNSRATSAPPRPNS